MASGLVKCMIEVGTREVKTVYWITVVQVEVRKDRKIGEWNQQVERRNKTDAELRKHREQKGLETPLVYAVNDVH